MDEELLMDGWEVDQEDYSDYEPDDVRDVIYEK